MSTRQQRRAEERALTKPPGPDDPVCVQMGCTADEDLADLIELKKQTHDLCIEIAGEARTSGVKWMVGHGEWAVRVANDALANADPFDRDVYLNIKRWLEEHPRARLVVASCSVRPGTPDPYVQRGLAPKDGTPPARKEDGA